MHTINVDYARWNETYKYLNNRDNKYILSNFSDTTSMEEAKISCIFFTDSLGNIVYKKNIEADTKDIFTEAFAKNITSNVFKILSNKNIKTIRGIMLYDNNSSFNICRKNYKK